MKTHHQLLIDHLDSDGLFIEDYVFTNNGDLDEYNGRFEINDDYPNGVYAYHATD